MINISFFSYKGGAGRTSLLYNTLPFLAEKLQATEAEPIVVLDLDIDSKGLSFLLDKRNLCQVNTIEVLRQDSSLGFRAAGDISNHPFFGKLLPIGYAVGLEDDRSILFVSAHPKEGARYLTENGNYDQGSISMELLDTICDNYHCKAIVMDTPAGNQLSAEKALEISDKVVMTMRITQQFQMGTEEFLRAKSAVRDGIEYIVVPNAVPPTEGTLYDIDRIMSDISDGARHALEASASCLNLTMLENGRTGVNEVNRFKFKEENLRKIERDGTTPLAEDERKAVEMYKLLAEVLANAVNT